MARPFAVSLLVLSVITGCTADGRPAGGAIPDGAIPSFAIPSFAIPSFEIPSFEIPSFEIPTFAIPSYAVPSFGPPSFGTSDQCTLVTSAQLATITGQPWTLVDAADPLNCTFIGDSSQPVSGVNVRRSTRESISIGKVLDATGQDLSVAGHTAYWGPSFQILYVDLGAGTTLIVQVTSSDATAGFALVQKIANALLAG